MNVEKTYKRISVDNLVLNEKKTKAQCYGFWWDIQNDGQNNLFVYVDISFVSKYCLTIKS
jgi:hypothetical protein